MYLLKEQMDNDTNMFSFDWTTGQIILGCTWMVLPVTSQSILLGRLVLGSRLDVT
jgi:hypothetical protein